MIYLSFKVHLDNYEIDEFLRPKGPLFHRWLPNGKCDLVTIHENGDNRIDIWFERRGEVEGKMIRYDRKATEVDESIMRLQAHLDAGQLLGEARFEDVKQSEWDAILVQNTESTEYIALGKKIVKFLYSPISRFISVLRNQYGQYWLRELHSWDSRKESLGSYCSTTLWIK